MPIATLAHRGGMDIVLQYHYLDVLSSNSLVFASVIMFMLIIIEGAPGAPWADFAR